MNIKALKCNEKGVITRVNYKPGWIIRFIANADHYYLTFAHKDQPDASKFKTSNDYENLEQLNTVSPVFRKTMMTRESFDNMTEVEFF